MLYKKYHRNYIRKFRKGVKFIVRIKISGSTVIDTNVEYVVLKEPVVIYNRFIGIDNMKESLIFHSGVVNRNIFIKNCTKNTIRIMLGNLRDLLVYVRTWIYKELIDAIQKIS